MPETVFRPPIQAHIVGNADNRFYAQKGTEPIMYILPKAAFVTKRNALLADGRGEANAWIPSPQDAPGYLGGVSTVTIICLSDEEDRRCRQLNCNTCRNHECVEYTGPQGRSAPSWHTLPPRGIVVSAWTFQG